MAGHFQLGHERHAAGVGVGHQLLQLLQLVDAGRDAAVGPVVLRAELGVLGGRERPALVVGQVQLQVAGLVEPAELHHLLDGVDRMVLPRHVEHDAAVVGMRPVLDGHSGQTNVALGLAKQLQERGRAFGRRPIVEARHDRLLDRWRSCGRRRSSAPARGFASTRICSPALIVGSIFRTISPARPGPAVTSSFRPVSLAISSGEHVRQRLEFIGAGHDPALGREPQVSRTLLQRFGPRDQVQIGMRIGRVGCGHSSRARSADRDNKHQ